MKAGSGSIANPSAATEVSMVGFSLKTKSAPSRSPVSSGPRSERASTVRNNLRKLLVSTIDEWSENAEPNERNTQEQRQGKALLVSLVLKNEAVYESDSDPSED